MLTKILPKLLKDLNERGECILPLDEANLLSLKLSEEVQEPQQVRVQKALREALIP